jgi:hypothetical protein
MTHVNLACLKTRGPLDRSRMDLVHGTMDIFYGISIREIIQIILKIHRRLAILQKHP